MYQEYSPHGPPPMIAPSVFPAVSSVVSPKQDSSSPQQQQPGAFSTPTTTKVFVPSYSEGKGNLLFRPQPNSDHNLLSSPVGSVESTTATDTKPEHIIDEIYKMRKIADLKLEMARLGATDKKQSPFRISKEGQKGSPMKLDELLPTYIGGTIYTVLQTSLVVSAELLGYLFTTACTCIESLFYRGGYFEDKFTQFQLIYAGLIDDIDALIAQVKMQELIPKTLEGPMAAVAEDVTKMIEGMSTVMLDLIPMKAKASIPLDGNPVASVNAALLAFISTRDILTLTSGFVGTWGLFLYKYMFLPLQSVLYTVLSALYSSLSKIFFSFISTDYWGSSKVVELQEDSLGDEVDPLLFSPPIHEDGGASKNAATVEAPPGEDWSAVKSIQFDAIKKERHSTQGNELQKKKPKQNHPLPNNGFRNKKMEKTEKNKNRKQANNLTATQQDPITASEDPIKPVDRHGVISISQSVIAEDEFHPPNNLVTFPSSSSTMLPPSSSSSSSSSSMPSSSPSSSELETARLERLRRIKHGSRNENVGAQNVMSKSQKEDDTGDDFNKDHQSHLKEQEQVLESKNDVEDVFTFWNDPSFNNLAPQLPIEEEATPMDLKHHANAVVADPYVDFSSDIIAQEHVSPSSFISDDALISVVSLNDSTVYANDTYSFVDVHNLTDVHLLDPTLISLANTSHSNFTNISAPQLTVSVPFATKEVLEHPPFSPEKTNAVPSPTVDGRIEKTREPRTWSSFFGADVPLNKKSEEGEVGYDEALSVPIADPVLESDVVAGDPLSPLATSSLTTSESSATAVISVEAMDTLQTSSTPAMFVDTFPVPEEGMATEELEDDKDGQHIFQEEVLVNDVPEASVLYEDTEHSDDISHHAGEEL